MTIAQAPPSVPIAHEAEIEKQTFTYRTVASSELLHADVYRRPDFKRPPVIIFIHGGALMTGQRTLPTRPGSLVSFLLGVGYTVVSSDAETYEQVVRFLKQN